MAVAWPMRSNLRSRVWNDTLMSLPSLAGAVLIALSFVVGSALLAIRAPLFDPPGMGVRLRLYLTTNIAQTSREPALPELAPILLIGGTEAALQAILQAAPELGWQEVTVDEANAQVRAVIVSPVFRFSDDIQVRLLARSFDRTEVAVRSSSRVGRGDLGANVHHIMALRDALSRHADLIENSA